MKEWKTRWGYEMSANSVRPGIYRLKAGGYFVTLKVKSKRSSRVANIQKALHGANLLEAQQWRDTERASLVAKLEGKPLQAQLFSEFAALHFEAKVEAGEIKSAKSRETWEGALVNHIIPRFGDIYCTSIQELDVDEWRQDLAKKIRARQLSPRTANGWFTKFRVLTKAMARRFKIADPAAELRNFDESQRPTYTVEEPNTFTREWARKFLDKMRELYPQFYAMVLLGFATGKRPSTLRPLRREGPHSDVNWEEGYIDFRQSHTRKREVMVGTKTGRHERVYLPAEVMKVLREHVQSLDRPKMIASDLLFPSHRGSFRASSVLDKPFHDVARAIKLPFKVTPRAMRRTFNDLARAANVHDVVTRSITGHVTKSMQEHYSTATPEEQRRAVADVINMSERRSKSGNRSGRQTG